MPIHIPIDIRVYDVLDLNSPWHTLIGGDVSETGVKGFSLGLYCTSGSHYII